MAEKKQAEKTAKKTSTSKKAKPSIKIPSIPELFKAGAQFGHETRRWNPKMEKYIYDVKGNIHIIDVTKTREQLEKAVQFLLKASSEGSIIFVGTKKQASSIVRNSAINSGSHFIDQRWAGGTLTNFKKIKESFSKLKNLESMFEKGVEDRTKYEVSLMKKEWGKLSRLYSGVKTLDSFPKALVVVDVNFEHNAVSEANILGIPVVGLVDSNSNPDNIAYPIPSNDDAISVITLLTNALAGAIKEGNKGKGVDHDLKDYSKVEIQIIKKSEIAKDLQSIDFEMPKSGKTIKKIPKIVKSRKKGSKPTGKGILEKVQEEKEKKNSPLKKK